MVFLAKKSHETWSYAFLSCHSWIVKSCIQMRIATNILASLMAVYVLSCGLLKCNGTTHLQDFCEQYKNRTARKSLIMRTIYTSDYACLNIIRRVQPEWSFDRAHVGRLLITWTWWVLILYTLFLWISILAWFSSKIWDSYTSQSCTRYLSWNWNNVMWCWNDSQTVFWVL